MFFFISILAGVLTLLAPCILPLLPIVIGAAEPGEKRRISRRAVTIIFSLALSIVVFTLLLRASTLLIDIPPAFWQWFSGVIIIALGVVFIFPSLWVNLPFIKSINIASNKAVGVGYQKKSLTGDILVGVALGPVFTTCSPTYFFVLGSVLPASFSLGLLYLIGFTIGVTFSLLVLAYFGQRLVNLLMDKVIKGRYLKIIFGLLFVLVGVAIITGWDKQLETYILDQGYGATINFEEGLIERFNR